jgi:hypothetical protein
MPYLSSSLGIMTTSFFLELKADADCGQKIRGQCDDEYFGVFCQFLAKILAFFHYLTRCILLKTANSFARFFGENIFKLLTFVPGANKKP